MSKVRKIIINHLLSQNDWMQSKLVFYKNKTINISISEYEFFFKIQDNGQLEIVDRPEKVDCTIKLTMNELIT